MLASCSISLIVSPQLAQPSKHLVQVGGMEPGLVGEPDKIKQPDLTGMDDGHAETSASRTYSTTAD